MIGVDIGIKTLRDIVGTIAIMTMLKTVIGMMNVMMIIIEAIETSRGGSPRRGARSAGAALAPFVTLPRSGLKRSEVGAKRREGWGNELASQNSSGNGRLILEIKYRVEAGIVERSDLRSRGSLRPSGANRVATPQRETELCENGLAASEAAAGRCRHENRAS